MRDTFLKLQTSNRRSNQSNHNIACYEPNVKIWAQSNGYWVGKVNFTKIAHIRKIHSRPTTKSTRPTTAWCIQNMRNNVKYHSFMNIWTPNSKIYQKLIASLTWKELVQMTRISNSEHHNSGDNLVSWKIVEQNKTRLLRWVPKKIRK